MLGAAVRGVAGVYRPWAKVNVDLVPGSWSGTVYPIKFCLHKRKITCPTCWERAQKGIKVRGEYTAVEIVLMMVPVSFFFFF